MISATRPEKSPLTPTNVSILHSTKKEATMQPSAGITRKALIHPAALRLTKASVTASGPFPGNGIKYATKPLRLSHSATNACHQSGSRKLPSEIAL